MFNHPLEILFSPLLVGQGLYTKWKTPRLNEAEGIRSGQVGSGQGLKLLITGDSAAAGVGVEQQTEALSGQIIEKIKNDFNCTWTLHAKSGFTTQNLIDYLESLPAQKFDIAVISIGVNDATKPLSIKKWQTQIIILHTLLKDKFAVDYVIYTAVPPMHVFPALPQPLRYFLGKTAKKMNSTLNKMFKNEDDSTVLTVHFPLTAEFMANDGFHPNSKAYKLWAEQASQLIQNRYFS